MLGQSKTAFQAEIDSACEIIDFWRFNVHFAQELLDEQPTSDHTMWNQLEYRALEGFVYAVTPFNFTSIAANLPTAPALMGNTVVWKPASSAMFSAHYLMQLLEEAGMPPGVINFVAGDAATISKVLLSHRDLAGVHFTGSTGVFNDMWKTIGASMAGVPFVPAHRRRNRRQGLHRRAPVGGSGGARGRRSCAAASSSRVRSARPSAGFTYRARSGTRSATASSAMIDDIKMGDVEDFRNFMGAVIDKRAFEKISRVHRRRARRTRRSSPAASATAAPDTSSSPTLVETTEPLLSPALRRDVRSGGHRLRLRRSPSGRRRSRWSIATSPYALTGAVFAQDRRRSSKPRLRCATRPATSISTTSRPGRSSVSSRSAARAASGTNDKAGSKLNLVRWVSARTVKENFNPPQGLQVSIHGGGMRSSNVRQNRRCVSSVSD